jgi:hypothetical protein
MQHLTCLKRKQIVTNAADSWLLPQTPVLWHSAVSMALPVNRAMSHRLAADATALPPLCLETLHKSPC